MMDVKRIVVDELPNMCIDCKLSFYSRDNEVYICFATKNKIANSQVIPDWCPLELEEVCEWEQVEHDSYSATFLLGCKTKRMALGYSGSLTYVYCPSCGKRIVYKESE